jgi:hypothetical protein
VRREATSPGDPRGLGLTLLLARGLPAWLAAVTALGPAALPRPVVGPVGMAPPCVLPASRRELTMILAGMVLACTRTPEEGSCPAPR